MAKDTRREDMRTSHIIFGIVFALSVVAVTMITLRQDPYQIHHFGVSEIIPGTIGELLVLYGVPYVIYLYITDRRKKKTKDVTS